VKSCTPRSNATERTGTTANHALRSDTECFQCLKRSSPDVPPQILLTAVTSYGAKPADTPN
jgi:hypothetical protein